LSSARTASTVGARRELHQDVGRRAAELVRVQALRQAVVHERDRRGGERTRVLRAADDLQPVVEHLAIVADLELAVALDRRVVEEHVRAAAQILEVALAHVPRQVPACEILERVHQSSFLRAARQGDVHEPDDQVVGALDAGGRAHALHGVLAERMREVDVRRVARRHPEIGWDVLDGDRGVVEQSKEQPDLNEHQGDGEGDAGHRDQEAQLVVQQVLAGKVDHWRCSPAGQSLGPHDVL
jgi:hypothetical protein